MSTVCEIARPSKRRSIGRSQDRLDSWKEIALYLRREVRTVQRWEHFEGLPVRRLFHRKAGSVYAFAHELDAWLEARLRSGERSKQVKDAQDHPLWILRNFPIRTKSKPHGESNPKQNVKFASIASKGSSNTDVQIVTLDLALGAPNYSQDPDRREKMSRIVACYLILPQLTFSQIIRFLEGLYVSPSVDFGNCLAEKVEESEKRKGSDGNLSN